MPSLDPFALPLRDLQLIEASAGTGKTYTICLLYLRLLLTRQLTVEQVLVVTFTKAAAAELRERIRARLLEACTDATLRALCAQGSDLPDARVLALLQLALQSFDRAAIFTMHGFCQRALGEAPFIAGVPIRTTLMPDDNALRLEVVADFWRRRIQSGGASGLLIASLRQAGDSPQRYAEWLRHYQAKSLAQKCWSSPPPPESISCAETALHAAWQALCAHWAGQGAAVIAEVQANLPHLNGRSFRPESVALAAWQWQAWIDAGDPLHGGDDSKLKLFTSEALTHGLKKAALAAGIDPAMHPFFAQAHAWHKARAALQDGAARLRAALLREMLESCDAALRARKRSERIQTFDDLLHDLQQALAGPRGPALAERLRARYPAAMVDEFQDTDPLQLDILRAVYQGSALPLLLVGDPKQAIYRFRNADLPTYLRARTLVAQRHSLHDNQRASAPLIAACNALFGQHDGAFLEAGLRYPPAGVGSKPKARWVAPGSPAALQLWALPRDALGQPLSLAAARQASAQACASEIVRLLQGAARGKVALELPATAAHAGGRQPLRAGGIAVLVQSHAQGRLIRAALERREVGCVELSQSNIFLTPDALELLRLLEGIAEPARESQLGSALCTLLLGCSASALAALRDSEQGMADVMGRFEQARSQWLQRGFGVMIRRFLDEHGVTARLLSRQDGARRMTNLRHLLELLHEASRTCTTPAALLAWLHARIADPEAGETTQLRLESDAHLVKIVTIHAAKGLEYPVVFCPFLWVNSQRRESSGACLEYHREDHSLVLDYRTAAERAPEMAQIKARRRRAEDAERLRLIYVAVTRAAQRCYLVVGACHNGRPDSKGQWPITQSARSPLHWLLAGGGQDFDAWRDDWAPRAQEIDALWQDFAARLADHPQACALQPLPAADLRSLQLPLPDPAAFHAARPAQQLPQRRRVGSYSALMASHAGQMAGPGGAGAAPAPSVTIDSPAIEDALGRDVDQRAAAFEGLPAEDPPPHDILRFPRGPSAGTALHAVLEQVDLARPADWPAQVAAALQTHAAGLPGMRHGEDPARLRAMVLGMLDDLARTTLPTGFCLAQVARQRCLHETEFHLPAPLLRAEDLQAWLAAQGQSAPDVDFTPLEGHLKGFIDLIFEHQGRWYVLDWKSNHLGLTPEDYGPASLQAAVDQHGYALQALIYLLALDRLLARRLRDYQRERHLGGAIYLFLRGVRVNWPRTAGHTPGVWMLVPPPEALEGLAQVLAGKPWTTTGEAA